MNPLDLGSITVEELLTVPSRELQTFQATLNEAIEQRKEQDKSELYDKIASLTTESGFSLDEVLGGGSSKKIKMVKYRNPSNTKQMWAGRGRKPNWLLELIAGGRRIEEFRV
jgi:DNA-binding protein H-NS